ncbi:universal stress protein [Olivibacter sitiensis]|uniref:universal stress protein n=1 Tax=Olivibacter sitiensis TaxID=376470 RepID=UPI0004230090|nr:universal stress protein [Olivibacter sitiensis]
MKTAIVLTDFSESATCAAKYAATVAKSLGIEDILLFHAAHIVTQTAAAQVVVLEGINRKEETEMLLDELADELKKIDGSLHYRTKYEEVYVSNVINGLVRQYDPYMVFIGLSGKSNAEKFVVGSNTLKLINTCQVPLMVVPRKDFALPKDLIYATDLKKVASTSPIHLIKELISKLHANLHIVNVSSSGIRLKNTDFDEIGDLHELFDNEHAIYHYLDNSSTVEGLLSFAESKANAIILAVAKEHGFFSKLIKGSITEKLAAISKNPLLIVKNDNF